MEVAPTRIIFTEESLKLLKFQKFEALAEKLIEHVNTLSSVEIDGSVDFHMDASILNLELQDLNNEAKMLKSLKIMNLVPCDVLCMLLKAVEKIVAFTARSVLPCSGVAVKEGNLAIITMALSASLTALYIMTSPSAQQEIFAEEIIEAIVIFLRHCIEKFIQFSCASLRSINHKKEMFGAKTTKVREGDDKERSISTICKKICECLSLLPELVHAQKLTDTITCHVSSIGFTVFFVENDNELQFVAMKLITEMFIKYKSHRHMLLNDALSFLMNFSCNKNKLKTYRLNALETIQIFTALIVQLLHAAVDFSIQETIKSKQEVAQKQKFLKQIFGNMLEDYRTVNQMAADFIANFLNRCLNTHETVHKAMFRNFIDDILLIFNKPEWPGAEMMLHILEKVMVCNLANQKNDLSLRLSCLDYLGLISAMMIKSTVMSQIQIDALDKAIEFFKLQYHECENGAEKELENRASNLSNEECRIIYAQEIILRYLIAKAQHDSSATYARNFIMCHWYRTTELQKNILSIPKSHKDKINVFEAVCAERKNTANKAHIKMKKVPKSVTFQNVQEWVLLKDIGNSEGFWQPSHKDPEIYNDYSSINLFSLYLTSKRSSLKSIGRFVQQILLALTENSVLLRSRAVKSLTKIVEADPTILCRCDIQKGMQHCFLDTAVSVREAAFDLIGKYILLQPEFIDQYYDLLSSRILDTGASVRKRIINIFRDACTKYSQHPKVPEMCLQIIQHIHDEEGVKKLVLQAFQKMWFTPVAEQPFLESTALSNKVANILDVVALFLNVGLESFDELLSTLFRTCTDQLKGSATVEKPNMTIKACQQIVDYLTEKVLKEGAVSNKGALALSSSEHFVLCFISLERFVTAHPNLLVKHAVTLGPYLSIKCQTLGDYQIITSVAHIMELTVPLLEKPSEIFLSQMEEDTLKVILQHDQLVVASCVSCLASLVHNVTRNFDLIQDSFLTFHAFLQNFKSDYQKDPLLPFLEKKRPSLRRVLFTTGLFLKYFDFKNKNLYKHLDGNVIEQVYHMLLYYIVQPDDSTQLCALTAMGLMCARYYDIMLKSSLKSMYHEHLTSTATPMKMQVLSNIELFLREEARSSFAQYKERPEKSNEEELKKLSDVSAGMASTIIQLYIKEILDCYIHHIVDVRQAVARITMLVLQQGLLQPLQIMPFLIAMSTDTDKSISIAADQQLNEIVIRYPEYITSKLLSGIWLSYKLQKNSGTVRGYTICQNIPKALNSFTYSIVSKTKKQQRAFVSTILRQFDDQMDITLEQMIYLVDNLAYFPYKIQDEPLYIIHLIDIIIATCGNNVLQSFEEALLPKQNQSQDEVNSAIVSENEENLLQHLPEDTTTLCKYIIASKGYILLLQLKHHLMGQYGLTNKKVVHYSVSDTSKMYEKPINYQNQVHFFEPNIGTDNHEPINKEKNRILVKDYLHFKRVMHKFEAEESDDELQEGTLSESKRISEETISESIPNSRY